MNHWWRHIVEQQVEALPNLWEHRERLTRSPIGKLDDLLRFDSRICAQVEALELEGPAAAELCADCWRSGRRGEQFAEAAILIGWRERFPRQPPVDFDPVASAFGFVSEAAALSLVDVLGQSTAVADIDLASRALRARRIPWPWDWPAWLERPLCRSLLVLPGFTGDVRAQTFLERTSSSDVPPDIRAAADWSRWILWRDPDVLMRLVKTGLGAGLSEGLAKIALRLVPDSLFDNVIAACHDDDRLKVLAFGASGQGKHLPALQRAARDPVTRSAALEGIFLMTGSPSAAKALALANEEPGVDPEIDRRREDAVSDLFRELADGSRAYAHDQRYLCGEPVTHGTSRQIILSAPQLARAAAAVELRRDAPPGTIFNVLAPAPEQKIQLTAVRTEAV